MIDISCVPKSTLLGIRENVVYKYQYLEKEEKVNSSFMK